MTYPLLRRIHLLAGLLSFCMLLMYGVSALQMAHPKWFRLTPSVTIRHERLTPGLTGAREVAQALSLRGDLDSVKQERDGFSLRIVLPGLVHEIRYEGSSGDARIKTSRAGFLGLLNRLHHAAGFWHEPGTMKLWALLVAAASLGLLVLGVTGLWMWFARRQDRVLGAVLLSFNLLFALYVLVRLRLAGP